MLLTTVKSGVRINFRSDASGELRFPWMKPGQYSIGAVCAGFFPWGRDINISQAGVDLGEVPLYKTLAVTGRAMYERSGIPVEEANVSVQAGWYSPAGYMSMSCAEGTTDSGGYFRLAFSNPFAEVQLQSVLSFSMGIDISRESSHGSRSFSCTDATRPGVVDLGRVELQVVEEM